MKLALVIVFFLFLVFALFLWGAQKNEKGILRAANTDGTSFMQLDETGSSLAQLLGARDDSAFLLERDRVFSLLNQNASIRDQDHRSTLEEFWTLAFVFEAEMLETYNFGLTYDRDLNDQIRTLVYESEDFRFQFSAYFFDYKQSGMIDEMLASRKFAREIFRSGVLPK